MKYTNLSASSLSNEEVSINKYNKKDKKINYDDIEEKIKSIEINSLTESSNNNSRMFAKNIKYKNKKTYSKYNNIKDPMIKGTRRLYVPNRNYLKEGNMSDVLTNVENDKRRENKEKRNNKRRNDDSEKEEEIDEVEDESSIDKETTELSRTKKSTKKTSKKSKKSKKYDLTSESSLVSLSSEGVDTYHQKTMTGTEAEKIMGRPMQLENNAQQDIINMLPEGYNGPIPQGLIQQQAPPTGPKINSIGRFLNHTPNDMMQPQNLPTSIVPGGENGMPDMSAIIGQQMMQQPSQAPQLMHPQMMQQQLMPQQMMQQQFMQQQMINPMQQTVTLSEGGINQQIQGLPQNGLTFDQALKQQGGSKGKRSLKLKKDFFF